MLPPISPLFTEPPALFGLTRFHGWKGFCSWVIRSGISFATRVFSVPRLLEIQEFRHGVIPILFKGFRVWTPVHEKHRFSIREALHGLLDAVPWGICAV